jgi:hypothetical protein
MARSRQPILDAVAAGLPVVPSDVVQVSPGWTSLTYCHAWDDVTPRVRTAVATCARKFAQQVADRVRRPVDVLALDGRLLDRVEPSPPEPKP